MAVWVATTGSDIPEGAIRGGYEADGRPLFIARAKIGDTMTPGKCGFHLPGAHIPYDMNEKIINKYDVLVYPLKNSGFLDWQTASQGNVPPNAYMTDRETYVGRAVYQGSLVPGKIATGHRHRCAYISYGGKEISFKDMRSCVR
ncbi:uncharacterized protein LOC133193779 [Saccostrea echinata]|uniref:uncharacterized protein LOC133193779 n=1 Tax=Saccostrea echinata TaxID=191078 RepID=UPI002A7F2CC3|nr:uncharacterized protein LOC133193779 [Saccostrea echinata]